jgi:Tfp pilus assembly protein PilW
MRQKGVTLIELLVTTVLVMIVGFMVAEIFVQSNTVFFSQNAKITQGLGINQTSLVINDSIKSASAVVTTSPTIPAYSSTATTLVLAIPSLDNSGNAVAGSSDYLVFTPDNSNAQILRQIVLPTLPQSHRLAVSQVLLTDLSSVNFIYQDQAGNPVAPASSSRISYTVILSEKAGLSNQQNRTSSVVNLRNI